MQTIHLIIEVFLVHRVTPQKSLMLNVVKKKLGSGFWGSKIRVGRVTRKYIFCLFRPKENSLASYQACNLENHWPHMLQIFSLIKKLWASLLINWFLRPSLKICSFAVSLPARPNTPLPKYFFLHMQISDWPIIHNLP